MAIDGVSSNTMRITGMATGMDTDEMVKKMLLAEKMKIDKVQQERQTVQWKQESYRDIISDLSSLKDTYFDVLNPEKNMLSARTYSGFDITNEDSSIATATAQTGAEEGNYKLEITQLAESAKIRGTKPVSTSYKSADITDLANWEGRKLVFDVNGNDVEIQLGSSYDNVDALNADINAKIQAKTELNGKISVPIGVGAKGVTFNISTNETIKISNATDVLSDLEDIKNKEMNSNSVTKLSDLDDSIPDIISFKLDYNGESKIVTLGSSSEDSAKNKTINDLIQAINSQTSGNVIAKFSELTGKISIETAKTGNDASIQIDNDTTTDETRSASSSLLSALNITGEATTDSGIDAKAKITPPGETTGVEVTKSTNRFTIDNVTYNLNKVETTNITVTQNVDKTFDKLKEFIGKYNEVIDKIQDKIEEKKNLSYKPLTDEQRESMSEKQIEKWEKEAKKGLLKNDNTLENMLSSLRGAFFKGVNGTSISFGKNSIGLDTSADITERGKIVIADEEKLKEVLKNNGKAVLDLFTKSSDISYSRTMSSDDREKRDKEVGIFQRISDILNDNISTRRDTNGHKGTLLEKAGIKNDTSFIKNILTKQIKEKDKLIKEMKRKMYAKEDRYYQMFAKVEAAMNKLNSQSSWLAQQLGTAQ